jgi:hypothetical protein
VITVLVDHNLEGQAQLIWGILASDGWLDLIQLRLATLADLGLPFSSSDRVIWRTAQAQRMLLLTGNRAQRGDDSLEQTLREEGTPVSLPVITVASIDRLGERFYRKRCAERLIEIIVDLERYLGTGRLFIP